MPGDPVRRRPRRRRWLKVLAVLAVAYLVAAVVAVQNARAESTASRVAIHLEPLALATVVAGEGDLAARDAAAVAVAGQAMSQSIEAAAEDAAGRPVTLSATVDVERDELLLLVDADDDAASVRAATAALEAFVSLRTDSGIAEAESATTDLEARLDALQAERDATVTAEQRASVDERIVTVEDRLEAVEVAGEMWSTGRTSTLVAGPSDPADESSWFNSAMVAFFVVLLVFSAFSIIRRRWSGLLDRRHLRRLPLPLGGVLSSGQDLATLAAAAQPDAEAGSGVVVQLLGPAPSGLADAAAPMDLAYELAGAAGAVRVVVVDGALAQAPTPAAAAGRASSFADLLTGSVVDPPQPGTPLVLDAGSVTSDPVAVIPTPRAAAAVRALAQQADLVLLVTPPATSLSGVAWTAHADRVHLLGIEGHTRRARLREAARVLASYRVGASLLVVAPVLLGHPAWGVHQAVPVAEPAH